MDELLKEELNTLLEVLEMRRTGKEIPDDELDNHLEQCAGRYYYWSVKQAEADELIDIYDDALDRWLAKEKIAAKDALRNKWGKNSNITEKDAFASVVLDLEKEKTYLEMKAKVRQAKKDASIIGSASKAFDLRGFHLMNLGNRRKRQEGQRDSTGSVGKPIGKF